MKILKNSARQVLTSILATTLLILYWVWMLYVTQPATADNTYQLQAQIQNVTSRLATHRGSDKLYIFAQNNYYMLDLGWRNHTKTKVLQKQLQDINGQVNLTIWAHYPKWFFDLNCASVKVQQVVAIKHEQEVYWSFATHNDYQQQERIAGVIAGVVFLVMVVAFDSIALTVIRKRSRRA